MIPLPELCLINIFEYFKEDCYTLHSCALVNRDWCLFAIPLLWQNPLEFCHKLGQRKHIMSLVYTYIACLPEVTRQKIGIRVMLQKRPLFDYTKYLRYLLLRVLYYGLEEILSFCQEYEIYSITMIRSIYEALCIHILNHANAIETVNLLECGDLNIFELPGANKFLSGIKTLICDGDFRKTYIASNVCQDIVRLEVRPEEDSNVEDWIIILPEKNMTTIANLIRYQKKLLEIVLHQIDQNGFNVCWKYLAFSHVDYLQCIELYKVTFDAEFGLIQQFALFPNLQTLKMEDCTGDGSWTYIGPSSFKKLKDLILNKCFFNLRPFHKLLVQAKDSLHNIQFMNPYSAELIQSFIDCWSKAHITNITTIVLSIEEQHLESLIKLLKICKNLEYLHVYDMEIEMAITSLKSMKLMESIHLIPLPTINVDYELIELGQILPTTLRVFKVGMDWSFSLESLESFLTNLKAAPKMKILEFSHGYWFDDDYHDLITTYCPNLSNS